VTDRQRAGWGSQSLELVKAAIKKVATLLVPGGAFLQAVLSIVDAVFFFINNAERIAALIQTITNAVKDILAGNIGALAAKVEAVLASTIPIVLDFFATLVGIGSKIQGVIKDALAAIRAPVTAAIDAILLGIKNIVVGLIDKLVGKEKGPATDKAIAADAAKGKQGPDAKKAAEEPPPAPGTPMTEEQILNAIAPKLATPTKASNPEDALAEKKAQAELLKQQFQPSAPTGKTLKINFTDKSAEDVKKDREVDMDIGFSPGRAVVAKVAEDDCGDGAIVQNFSRNGVHVIFTPRLLANTSEGTAAGLTDGQYPAFGDDGLQRAHVLGAQLGGPGTRNNLVLTSTKLNHPEMSTLENRVKRGVKSGHAIDYSVKVEFAGPPIVANQKTARDIAIDAEFTNSQIISIQGTGRFFDPIATSVTLSAQEIDQCPSDPDAQGDSVFDSFTKTLTNRTPLIEPRRRAAIALAFPGLVPRSR
jgi:hypothetical protein